MDLEVEATTVSHWEIEDWRGLDKRVHGPEFEVAGYKWCVLFEKVSLCIGIEDCIN